MPVEIALNIPLSISPNPSNGKFVIDWRAVENYTPQYIRVVDIAGKILFEKTDIDAGLKMQHLDLQHFANGIYFIQLKNTERVISRKIVLQR
jgi:Secretion system C-terminal sorting domain